MARASFVCCPVHFPLLVRPQLTSAVDFIKQSPRPSPLIASNKQVDLVPARLTEIHGERSWKWSFIGKLSRRRREIRRSGVSSCSPARPYFSIDIF
ncbi:hypothetical protein GWI33_016838 [Rhynchophorus ferrugineus]|uniref:Uncharacterized protein n=1 Tax=Rhynchophorus ferrugineus TaxID=354439 RepID=A0A834M2Y2_RHYFE|nr:hypothetical protein GWI33_016838 [Rhynchophorus ferrugineus]